ncbi:MAG: hypothetical protein ACJAQT_000110 [Akkermansiaceae bacterium]|jgi:hypothetical protein
MASSQDPYQAPDEGDFDLGEIDPFHSWTTRKMVVLFFLPALALVLAAVGEFSEIPLLLFGGLVTCGCGALTVTIFSALVYQRRQNAGWGTFFLMIFVYLIAQIFALFLAVALISIAMEKLSLRIH